jgi:signal peptide peptidase SppA
MRYDRLFSKLYGPLLLEPRAWHGFERALLNIATRDVPHDASHRDAATKLSPESKRARLDNVLELVSSDTALLHISGAIDKHISAFEMECFGGYDLRDLDAAINTVANDPSIQNVMLVINSPGGSVTGVPETAAKIASLSQTKNVFAFSDGMCCSAAYYIASQADQIFGTASSDIGSIGVYCALLDISRQLEYEGVTVNFIKSGTLKGAGAPFQPLMQEERNMFQAEVDKIGAMFRTAVSAKRSDVSSATMQGQSFFGDEALRAGLCDAIVADLSEALSQF